MNVIQHASAENDFWARSYYYNTGTIKNVLKQFEERNFKGIEFTIIALIAIVWRLRPFGQSATTHIDIVILIPN